MKTKLYKEDSAEEFSTQVYLKNTNIILYNINLLKVAW